MLKKLSLIFLILRGCSPTYAQTTITLQPPFTIQTTGTNTANMGVSQGFLDSSKASYNLATVANQNATAATTTANNTQGNLNTTNSTVASQGLKLTATSNLTSQNAVDVTILQATIDSFRRNWPSGGITLPSPISNALTSYQITQANNGGIITLNGKCTVTFSSSLLPNFICTIYQGTANPVTMSGVNINTPNGATIIKFKGGRCDVKCVASGIVNISGDLKAK